MGRISPNCLTSLVKNSPADLTSSVNSSRHIAYRNYDREESTSIISSRFPSRICGLHSIESNTLTWYSPVRLYIYRAIPCYACHDPPCAFCPNPSSFSFLPTAVSWCHCYPLPCSLLLLISLYIMITVHGSQASYRYVPDPITPRLNEQPQPPHTYTLCRHRTFKPTIGKAGCKFLADAS